MKSAYKFLLLSLFCWGVISDSYCSGASFQDRIKERCVTVLPQNWQNNARAWFWPAVTAVAVLACTGAYCWLKLRTPLVPKDAFMDMAYDLLSADPVVDGRQVIGAYVVALHPFEDGSGATLRFKLREGPFYAVTERQIAAYIIAFPVKNLVQYVNAAVSKLTQMTQ